MILLYAKLPAEWISETMVISLMTLVAHDYGHTCHEYDSVGGCGGGGGGTQRERGGEGEGEGK